MTATEQIVKDAVDSVMAAAVARSQPDPNAGYKTEYAAMSSAYMAAGLSEADYIETRRIDDGVVDLPFGRFPTMEQAQELPPAGRYVGGNPLMVRFPQDGECGSDSV